MKKNTFFVLRMLAVLLTFGVLLTACSKKAEAQVQSADGAAVDLAQAAGAAKDAAKNAAQAAKGAVKGGGKPAAASDFVYELNEEANGVVITDIQKDSKFGAHLVVPAEIEGYPVVAFLAWYDDNAAKERKQPPLESVVFPDSIIFLGESGIRVYKVKNTVGDKLEADYAELAPFKNYDNRATLRQNKSLKSVVFPRTSR